MKSDGAQRLNAAYWRTKCKDISSDTTMVMLEMGSISDYYRPGAGLSWCDMFTSSIGEYEFSRDGVKWVAIPEHKDHGHYGGSAAHKIPDASVSGDTRSHLSFWGSEDKDGGCCHASYSDKAAWGQAFTIYYQIPETAALAATTSNAPTTGGRVVMCWMQGRVSTRAKVKVFNGTMTVAMVDERASEH